MDLQLIVTYEISIKFFHSFVRYSSSKTLIFVAFIMCNHVVLTIAFSPSLRNSMGKFLLAWEIQL